MMTKFEIYKVKRGELRFRLKAGNNQVIGSSEMYSFTSAMQKGIASVKKNAPIAEIDDIS